ncbi:MAG: alkaline phosphatase [Nitrospirota bacterium]
MMRKRNVMAAAVAALMAVVALVGGAGHSIAKEKPAVKHIILFIGDGMQLEHEIATSRYLYGSDYGLAFHRLPYRGHATTWDVSTYDGYANVEGASLYTPSALVPGLGYNPNRGGKRPFPLDRSRIDDGYFLNPRFATDSASAGTALATGHKTVDGNIAWRAGEPDATGRRTDPADGALKTIAERLREEKGFAIGVVSTVPFSHATPAAFVSHNPSRNNYYAIADEIIRTVRPEVVIGGGHRSFSTSYLSEILYNDAKNSALGEYVFVEREAGKDGGASLLIAAETAKSLNKKLFGLFGGSGGNFEPPVPADMPGMPQVNRATVENPLLKDATLAALEVLSSDEDGFFVMIEQGDIDWANHANDYAWMIGTTWDLHEAVKAALQFVERPGDDIDWSNTLLLVTSDHGNSYMRLNNAARLEPGDLPAQVVKPAGYVCPSGSYCGTYLYPDDEVSYGTGSHTNELVTVYAKGNGARHLKEYEGAWYPCTTIIDNTQLFHAMTDAAGMTLVSPLKAILKRPVVCSPSSSGN